MSTNPLELRVDLRRLPSEGWWGHRFALKMETTGGGVKELLFSLELSR